MARRLRHARHQSFPKSITAHGTNMSSNVAAARAAPVSVGADDRPVLRSRVTRVVYTATVIWTIGFSVCAAVEQHLFLLRRYDLGNFTQAVWSAAHGHLFRV